MHLKSVENVITLGKLIGLLFLFCLPLLSILFLKTKRNDLARPVMGTIFLVYVGLSMGNQYKKYVCKNVWVEIRGPNTRILKVSFLGGLKQTEIRRLKNRGKKG